jgi:hypothetical protein
MSLKQPKGALAHGDTQFTFICVHLRRMLSLTSLRAQTSMASLVGIAKDASGAVVVGAKVEIRNHDTNAIRKAESDPRGEFIVPNLPPSIKPASSSRSISKLASRFDLKSEPSRKPSPSKPPSPSSTRRTASRATSWCPMKSCKCR